MDYSKYTKEELEEMRETITKQKEVVMQQINALLEIENGIVDALKTKANYME